MLCAGGLCLLGVVCCPLFVVCGLLFAVCSLFGRSLLVVVVCVVCCFVC